MTSPHSTARPEFPAENQTIAGVRANAPRISILDGFRAFCILAVIFFHYYAKETPPLGAVNLYPYGPALSRVVLFRYGYLGVHFFFVISGFVISLTLSRCESFWSFAVKRFARLWPSMLLCSVLTFVLLAALPVKFFTPSLRDFIPSLTFVDGGVYSYLHVKCLRNLDWIDGTYWTLFVEVRFYFWAGLLYFLCRTRFLLSLLCFTNLAVLLSVLQNNFIHVSRVQDAVSILLFPDWLPWFAAGTGFYYLYLDGKNRLAQAVVVESLLLLAGGAYFGHRLSELPFFLLIFALFYLFIYRPGWLAPFSWQPVTIVGAASYSLYLLHDFAGITLIAWLAQLTGVTGRWAIALSLVVIALMIAASILVYKLWEVPAKRLVLKICGQKRISS